MNVALPLDENRPGISGNENLKKTSCLPCHRKALELISITYADNFHVPDMNQINLCIFTNPVICSFFTEYAKSPGEIIPANLNTAGQSTLSGDHIRNRSDPDLTTPPKSSYLSRYFKP
jgi:hypothetical protein